VKFFFTSEVDSEVGPILRSITALGRYGKVENIANIVTFLASPKAQYITGTTLTVDGGANA
jgi:NAD(P)-dependent dehydrogenase (short-subunit alcohol dehydrogenase family)